MSNEFYSTLGGESKRSITGIDYKANTITDYHDYCQRQIKDIHSLLDVLDYQLKEIDDRLKSITYSCKPEHIVTKIQLCEQRKFILDLLVKIPKNN